MKTGNEVILSLFPEHQRVQVSNCLRSHPWSSEVIISSQGSLSLLQTRQWLVRNYCHRGGGEHYYQRASEFICSTSVCISLSAKPGELKAASASALNIKRWNQFSCKWIFSVWNLLIEFLRCSFSHWNADKLQSVGLWLSSERDLCERFETLTTNQYKRMKLNLFISNAVEICQYRD